MRYTSEQIEQWASVGWDAHHKGTNEPKFAELTGAAREKQLQIANDAAVYGASVGHPLEIAYQAAFGAWQKAQQQPVVIKKAPAVPVKPAVTKK